MPPNVKLDGCYKFVDGLNGLIPNGPPSMIKCDKLTIEGKMILAVRRAALARRPRPPTSPAHRVDSAYSRRGTPRRLCTDDAARRTPTAHAPRARHTHRAHITLRTHRMCAAQAGVVFQGEAKVVNAASEAKTLKAGTYTGTVEL